MSVFLGDIEVSAESITFVVLQARLIKCINSRINNGEFTERSLARILGISQPQMHNVRKGARRLSIAIGDRMLAKLNMSVLTLLEEEEVRDFLTQRKLPRKPPTEETQDERRTKAS